MRAALSAWLLFGLLALPAHAANLKLEDGTRVECKVRAYDSATQTLQVTTSDGQQRSFTMAQLDGRSVYQVNASLIPPDDAAAQVLAANFARDAGLYAHAARRYGIAEKLDPSLHDSIEAERVRLRRAAAAECMQRARKAVSAGDIPEATRWLETLVEKLPQEPEAEQASAMLERYYDQTRETEVAKAEAKADAELRSEAATARARYDRMIEKTRKGLQSRGSKQAERLFRDALSDGTAILAQFDAIQKRHDDPAVAEQIADYRKVVTDQMVEAHLHIASMLATRSDYHGAQREVNQGLALDPRHEQALSMRARIEEYSSRGIGWRF